MNTIWKLKYPFVILITSAALFYSLLKIEQVNVSQYQDTIILLQDLKQKNSDLNTEILKYKSFPTEENAIEMHSEQIKKSLEKVLLKISDKQVGFENSLGNLKSVVLQKITFIEKYKTENRELHTSLKDFLVAVSKEIESNQKIDVMIELHALLAGILEQNILSSKSDHVLEEIINRAKNSANPKLSKVLQYSESIQKRKQEVDQKTFSILLLPINEKIDTLLNTYQIFFTKENVLLENYKLVLYSSIFILLGMLLVILWNFYFIASTAVQLRQICKDLFDVFQKLGDSNHSIASTNKWLLEKHAENNISADDNNEAFQEIHGMFENNAKKCKNTLISLHKANGLIKESLEYSKKMVSAIKEIESSSSKTSHVVEDIQDIAKQNKLVGLNATIEASRLGSEVFTVVAKEVSHLAIRSAEALTETSRQILDTQEKSKQGSLLTENLLSYLCDINVKIKNICTVTEQLNDYFEKQKVNMDSFQKNIIFMNEHFEKHGQIAKDNTEIAESLSQLTNKLRANVAKTLQITQKLASY